MTKLTILPTAERERFDRPPRFNRNERTTYFALNKDVLGMLKSLRTINNKIGFMLQLGYFKSNRKFYTANLFRKDDIKYVIKSLGLHGYKFVAEEYHKKIPLDHRRKILASCNWKSLTQYQLNRLEKDLLWHTKNQLLPKQVFFIAIDYCWKNKIELPSYNQIALFITNSYNNHETKLIDILEKSLTKHQKQLLHLLVKSDEKQNKMHRAPITLLKQINQSLSPSNIQENVKAFNTIKNHFYQFETIIKKLSLSDQATEYFATWVQKSETFQLNSFANKNKLYLYLLAYIKHQYYFRQDILIDIVLKSVQSAMNAAKNKVTETEQATWHERDQAIKKLTQYSCENRLVLNDIRELVESSTLSETRKLDEIKLLLNSHYNNDRNNEQQIIAIEDSLNRINEDQMLYDAMESLSIKLQRRISNIIKSLDFNWETSNKEIIEAIDYFQSTSGNINYDAPISFLNNTEQTFLFKNGKIRLSLYKILLFMHIADDMKSGKLNLKYSYRYKAIHEYLISKSTWQQNKEALLKNAGLTDYQDYDTVIDNLKQKLNDKYEQVNTRFLAGENPNLSIDKNNIIKINTPKVDNDDDIGYVSSILKQVSFVPIPQVLFDVDQIANFNKCFKHHSIKHKKMKPKPETIYAGIMGKGCNVGITKIANISTGITEDILKNTVNWCFSLKNIQAANTKLITTIDSLALAEVFKYNKNLLHTGSDGRKVNVAVDSLHASYSYKYFGKDKGVSIYTFIDERHVLFHSTVISASEREAAYVIDGLLQNDVIKSDIHSTDTHGFTETIFSATYFIDVAFAPRLKNIGRQKIYSFKTRTFYKNKDYKILPSRTINKKIIAENWDDILRFIATIKLKHATASQLLKRLSSYAKDHPLYKALKEFGRIIKSIFILTYLDEEELRQRIEKQLNKVELFNKFAKAVFFANNQAFRYGSKEEQEIAAACMGLIQNAIILWNYLYLSQLLANNTNAEHRQHMVESIKHGSIITWQHINLQGEYDFTRHAANDQPFNMEKIMGLNIK